MLDYVRQFFSIPVAKKCEVKVEKRTGDVSNVVVVVRVRVGGLPDRTDLSRILSACWSPRMRSQAGKQYAQGSQALARALES